MISWRGTPTALACLGACTPSISTGFFLHNELARGQFPVAGESIHLQSITVPLFVVGTETDHVAPWRSVYKMRALTRSADYTFLLTSGGHNAGIVSGPVHPRRRHRLMTWHDATTVLSPEQWLEAAELRATSWWPSWQQWLRIHSSMPQVAPPAIGAPGEVMPCSAMRPVITSAKNDGARTLLRVSNAILPALSMSVMSLCAAADTPPAQITGLHDAVLGEYSPLSGNAELARRLLSPLSAAQIPELLAHAGKGLSEQPINLAQEKFAVYVPAQAPARGYALLVFVPPWSDARLPPGWAAVLDRYGVIFVSAARSGNDVTPLGRRAPLAIGCCI